MACKKCENYNCDNGLTLNNLKICFKAAYLNSKYIGVKISTEGSPKPEIIINPRDNFKSKLDYYKKAYNEDLTLKSFSGIKITGFSYGNSFEEIEKDLLGDE